MDIGISIVVTFLLVLVNGYFSMSEMALVNAKHVLLQKDADEGDKKAQRALSLASDSGQFLATIQVAITLVGFFASAAAEMCIRDSDGPVERLARLLDEPLEHGVDVCVLDVAPLVNLDVLDLAMHLT